MADLANRMIEYRAKHRVTQKALGAMCGITTQTVNYIESGRQTPSKVTKAKIELVIGKEQSEDAVIDQQD